MSHPALLSLADAPDALLAATVELGFSEEVALAGLEAELAAWTEPGALDAVLAELPAGLDPRRRPAHVLVIAARTLPASTMRAVLMGRLLGASVSVKPAAGQRAVAEALVAADPDVRLADFSSSDVARRDRAIAEAHAVLVLGSDDTVAAVRAATPASKAFVGYGHRVSAAWLTAPDDVALDGLAHDLCAWDQAGCLSPQVAWISQADPASVADRLAARVREVEATLPMTVPDGAHAPRRTALTRSQMLGSARTTDTAVVATLPSSSFLGSPGYRFLWVLPAEQAALDAVTPFLSSLAVAGPAPRLPAHVRVCAPGHLQRPPLTWPHDGRPNLIPLLQPNRRETA